MIPKGLFTQIGMMIVAVAIAVTYVQPTFDAISATQDDIGRYNEELKKVVTVNSQLATLVSRLESVSVDDQRRLLTYLPDQVDTIAVSRDLYLIAQASGVQYKNVQELGSDKRSSSRSSARTTAATVSENFPTPHQLELTVEGTYDQVTNLFQLLERNDYPLEVQSLSVQQQEGGFLSAVITVATYAYAPVAASN